MAATRLPDRLAARLRRQIAESGLVGGDRLPAERALAAELGASRGALREALQQLRSEGVLFSRVGGGTYVQGPAESTLIAPLTAYQPVMREDPDYRYDVLEARHALEGGAAWHAAQRATDEDRARIQAAFHAMWRAHARRDDAAEALADAQFHLAIAEASHNLVLLQVMRGLFELLQNNISQSRQRLYQAPRIGAALQNQHRAICDAIVAGDAERARTAMHAHLQYVYDALRALEQDEARRERASRLPPPGATP
ncbi:MAG TPA: transcriptional regulator LldR [Stenotrophomonas sp.]|jgi:GntR family L-lactate dehydrogenase operon transcriptional regulator